MISVTGIQNKMFSVLRTNSDSTVVVAEGFGLRAPNDQCHVVSYTPLLVVYTYSSSRLKTHYAQDNDLARNSIISTYYFRLFLFFLSYYFLLINNDCLFFFLIIIYIMYYVANK